MAQFVILTCEHGGNNIPPNYQSLFTHAAKILASHRGYDEGALPLFQALATQPWVNATYFVTISRLLVDLNRSVSVHHPHVWSEFTRSLGKEIQTAILNQHYMPHRQAIMNSIGRAIMAKQQVIHIAVHSFTPHFNGQTRQADIGLLYDPARPGERVFCQRWQTILTQLAPNWRIRRNYPYRGTSDGLTTFLRKQFTPRDYIGIELEVNQQLFATETQAIQQVVGDSLSQILLSAD